MQNYIANLEHPAQMKIYHNPRCGKSRQTLQRIADAGVEPEVIEYLNETPTDEELYGVVNKQGLEARESVRSEEQV